MERREEVIGKRPSPARLACLGVLCIALTFTLAESSQAASGTWDRAWGRNVNGGGAFGVCTVASSCLAGITGGLGGDVSGPGGVATDSNGNVYVADTGNNRIQKFDASGTWQRAWGNDVIQSGHPGDLGIVFEICTVAADCKAGATGGLGGEMTSPNSVATDTSGNVYVADYNGNRIQKFDTSGTWERAWGRNVNGGGVFGVCTVAASCLPGMQGGLGGEMNFPPGIATDSSGNVYVSELLGNRIQKFNASGTWERAWGRDVIQSGKPGDLGNAFEICTVAADCQVGQNFGLGGDLNQPGVLATDSAGNVYVPDSGNNRIQKFDSSGTWQRAWGKDVIQNAHPGDLGTVFEICTAVADCKAGTTGGTTCGGTFCLGGEMRGPQGIATDSGGNVYVAEASNYRIQKFDSSGTWQRAWGKDVIQSGKPGDLGAVFEICTVAADCQAFASGGLGGEMLFPQGVATDSGGNLYLADGLNHRIQKFADAVVPPGGGGGGGAGGGGGGAGGGGSAASPSNSFTFLLRTGQTLTVNVSTAGTVGVTQASTKTAGSSATVAAAKRLLKPSSASGGPPAITVKLRLTKLGNQLLRQKGKVTVNARITFTPNGGTANSQTTKLKIRKR